MFWKKWKKKKQVETVNLIEDGFEIVVNENKTIIKWSFIHKLIGYKVDLFTIDEICLHIEFDNKTALVTEDYLGWREFMSELLNQFPSINKNWEGTIAKSAFKRNETKLFDKK